MTLIINCKRCFRRLSKPIDSSFIIENAGICDSCILLLQEERLAQTEKKLFDTPYLNQEYKL